MNEASEHLSDKAAKLVQADVAVLSSLQSKQVECQNCTDIEKLTSGLKQKFLSSSKNQKVQFLHLFQTVGLSKKTAQEFCTSKHTVRKLKPEKCILAEPRPKCGKPLSELRQ